MTRGTPSYGKRNRTVHVLCRRCGKHAYHISKRRCAACGFGETSKRRDYEWHLWSR